MISTKQAAERLGISALRVQQLIRAGRLKAQKIGRDYVIDAADLTEVMERKPGRPVKNKETHTDS